VGRLSGVIPHAVHAPGLAIATLAVWLLAGSAGIYMFRTWLSRGGLRRQRSRPDGLSPLVLFTHLGLGAIGLATWVGYLATGWPALAWSAVGLLMLGIGLGISTVTLWTPYPTARGPRTGTPADATDPRGSGPATGMLASPAEDALARPMSDDALAKTLSNEALTGRLIDDMIADLPGQRRRKSRGNLAALIPAGHGLAAMITFGLAVITAISAR
jgi:hypothetical protein